MCIILRIYNTMACRILITGNDVDDSAINYASYILYAKIIPKGVGATTDDHFKSKQIKFIYSYIQNTFKIQWYT